MTNKGLSLFSLVMTVVVIIILAGMTVFTSMNIKTPTKHNLYSESSLRG